MVCERNISVEREDFATACHRLHYLIIIIIIVIIIIIIIVIS